MKALFKNKELFGLVHQFNVYPASYLHPSWVEDLMQPELFEKLRSSKRGMQRLSKIFLNQYHLSSEFCYDFETAQRRLSLISPIALKKLMIYCGLALHHRQIISLVEKDAISRIKESVGEDAYLFTIKRVPLLSGGLLANSVVWDRKTDFLSFIQKCGITFFLSQFNDSPPAILNRLILKFPKSITETICYHSPNKGDWQFIKRILLHEINPKWHQLFL